jgi:hypothetical protein
MRRAGISGSCRSPSCAKGKTWTKVASGSAVKKQVPRACAIRTSGAKKGSLRKGCKIRGGHAFCEVGVAERLPKSVFKKTKSGKRVEVSCK